MKILFAINSILRDFLKSLFGSINFSILKIVEILKYGLFRFCYSDNSISKCYVIANGPSLNNELSQLNNNIDFINSPKLVLNYFVFSDLYKELKPNIYCLADPDYFKGSLSSKDAETFVRINNDTSWNMTLFIPCNGKNVIKKFISNENIIVKPISYVPYDGFAFLKYPLYKRGYAVPSFVNVTIMAEFVLLNLGYKEIRLYGVDHTFFDGLTINDNNIPCFLDKHFNEVEQRPLVRGNGGYFTIAEWLMDKYLTFKEHENMRGYADYLGTRIVNCTKCSLIDAYVRLEQLEKEE